MISRLFCVADEWIVTQETVGYCSRDLFLLAAKRSPTGGLRPIEAKLLTHH